MSTYLVVGEGREEVSVVMRVPMPGPAHGEAPPGWAALAKPEHKLCPVLSASKQDIFP